MKPSAFAILLGLTTVLSAQDSTVFYTHWDRVSEGEVLSADSLKDRAYTAVRYHDELPVVVKSFSASGQVLTYRENEYDSLGNHVMRKEYYPQGGLKEEWRFENDLSEITLFQRIYGETFKPTNRNYTVQRSFNEQGRETGFYIRGVDGKDMCHQTTEYDDRTRKTKELLVDDLQGKTILERRYHYKDDRTILEEFDGRGKLIQRVVLFDDKVLPAQP